jgi:hypothetical protein
MAKDSVVIDIGAASDKQPAQLPLEKFTGFLAGFQARAPTESSAAQINHSLFFFAKASSIGRGDSIFQLRGGCP